VTGCTVENVTVSGEANVGNVVGAIAANGIIVENCTAAEPKVGGNYSDNKLVEARIGNAYYATFAAAYEAAKADETVTLVADVALAETFTIEKAITIDLGGKTVTGADGAIVFNVKAATIINNGTIKGNKSGTSSGLLDIYADLTMDGVTVETSKIIALRFKAGECTATLTDCNVTGAFKGYGGSVWNIVSGTYKASSTSISEQINGTASVSGGTFHYEIKETVCAPGYVVVDNGDGTWTVKYAPAAFVDANNNGVLDEGEAVYGNLDQVFANHKSGDVYVVLTADIVANEKVDTTANAKYYFTTNVAEGVTMDFLFADDWNYIQKASIGENITLNAKYFLGWTDIDLYGTINTTYAYFTGADVTIHEGAVLNAKTGDATVQVKDNTTLTVNGTVNTAILNVWVNVAKLIVSGKNAEVNASWIDIWDGTPSVTVENGATLDVDKIKASRGGSITVADATLLSDEIELGHNGESKGEMTITGNSTVTVSKIILTVVGSTVTGPEGLNVTTTVENSKVVYENGVYKVVGFVYVAEVNGVQYETVSEAIMAAFVGTNKEVVLLKSVEIEKVGGVSTLILYNGIILDLNGYSLTVDNFVALGTAQIIDSSNAKTGVLVAPKAGVVFNPANSQMPIWVGEGYKFASIVVNAMIDETNSSSNKLTLIFWPNFGKLNNIFANDDDKHINVSVVISWEKANGTRVSEKFTVSDALVKNVYTNGSAFSLAITGVENIKNIETYVVVESAKGVEARSQTFDYNVSDNLTE
ncbi:MAG: hypothetical protein IKU42_00985, partial [Oscillospiraceae bacterium]|nr:hypothetical protein [Oscillospiraceae bacterium]